MSLRGQRRLWNASRLERRVMLAADAGAAMSAMDGSAIQEVSSGLVADSSLVSGQVSTQGIDLVVIDATVSDISVLADGVAEGAEIVLLDANRNGVRQISDLLASRERVRGLHIVSHGDAASLKFAKGELNIDNVEQHRSQLRSWAQAFTQDADILLYACNAAEGESGRQLVQRIAELTGADVAASSDITGDVQRGGDWQLEEQFGQIESSLAFQIEVRANYRGTLIARDGNEYLLTSPNLTWSEAQAEATAAGGDLVTINDAAEEAWLRSVFGTDVYWIGINDVAEEGNFVWASGQPVGYTNWEPGEPSDWMGNQDHALMNVQGTNAWDDVNPTTQATGVIEIEGGGVGSSIEVRARGEEGGEQFELRVDGFSVGTYTTSTSLETFSYAASGTITADRLQVAFINDSYDPANDFDANLVVDYISIDGTVYQTEAPTTFSTGTWVRGTGFVDGFHQSETLSGNGYFQYDAQPGGSVIDIAARGIEGTERFDLLIDDQVVASYATTTAQHTFRHLSTSIVAASQVKVQYTNDRYDPANGIDADLVVDFISVDGAVYQTEAPTTYSTGTWVTGSGFIPGFRQSETLHGNGYFHYDQSQLSPGQLSLESSVISVGEAEGSVDVMIRRQNGSDGTVTVEYNTLDSSATAGSDYESRSGTAVFAPGETTQTISIPIVDDGDREGDEQFSFAIDVVTGGATLLVPRTATITIDDNDGISASGDGLLAEYFDNIDFTNRFPTQVDATVDFDWGASSPLTGMGADSFSVRWTGQIEPLYSDLYTFRTWSDDGIRLWVDDQLVIDEWNDHAPTFHTGSISLNAGQLYDIRMEHYENGGQAVAQLAWSSASQALEVVPQSQLYSADAPEPPVGGNLVAQDVWSGLIQPTSIDFSPDGQNMYITEQRGLVKVVRNGEIDIFVDIQDQVNGTRDRGLLDIAIHPDFENNPYVYLLFTYDPPEVFDNVGHSLAGPDQNGNRAGRLIRLTADAATDYTTPVFGSEVVLLGTNSTWENFNAFANSTNNFDEPPAGINPDGTNIRDFIATDSESHTVGAIEFGPDGSLFVSIGDGTSYNRVDERTVRVQDVDNLSGKVLRINPLTGQGYTDNPYYQGDLDANRAKVYQLGLRNPFRMTIGDAGQVYIGDVGWTQWEEINAGSAGANFGWPFYEGGSGVSLQTNGYRDLDGAPDFYNTTVVTPSLYALNHSATGINAIVLGDIYTGEAYPSEYQGDLFFNDLGQGIVRNISLDASGNITDVQTFATGANVVVQIVQGPDGNMYYVDLDDGTIGRWVFV